jgi:hypothetical protein
MANQCQQAGELTQRAVKDSRLLKHSRETRQYEREPTDDEPFDFEAQPSRFYFDVESVGNIKPDDVVIKASCPSGRSFFFLTDRNSGCVVCRESIRSFSN